MAATLEHLSVEVLPRGIVAPLTSLVLGSGGKKGTFDGGAYYCDGAVCTCSLQTKLGFRNEPRLLGSISDLPLVPGRHLYGGMLKNEHIGHFLVESLSRLWAIGVITSDIDSIVFYKRLPGHPVPTWASELLSLLAPSIPLTIVSAPTVFETLIVPSQIADPVEGFVYGHSLFRDVLLPLRRIPGRDFEKLYVSRSRLEAAQGSFLGEERFEEILAEDGFHIFHPQEHSIYEQISFFNGARTIVLAEGTAVHLFALTCRADQKALIIQRRRNSDVHALASQLRSFDCMANVGPGEPAHYLVPERNGRSYNGARVKIDFDKLRTQMVEAGITSEQEWNAPDEEYIAAEAARIEFSLGQRLIEHSSSSLHGLPPDLLADDVALCKPAVSSSVCKYSRYQDPARDACGANNESLAQDFGFHTDRETDPWWKVDLLEEHLVEEVAIVNRRSFPERFRTFRIDSSRDGSNWAARLTESDPIEVSSEMEWPWRVRFPEPFLARYIRITLLGQGPLHLRRIQVFAAGSLARGKRLIADLLAKHDPYDFFAERSELRRGLIGLVTDEDIVEPLRRMFAGLHDHRSIALLYEQARSYGWPVNPAPDDVAFCKPAVSSSVSPWSHYQDAERDACGANSESVAQDYGFHTNCEADPWWKVDLLEEYLVREVSIVNRRRCPERFGQFRIDTSCDGNAWTTRLMQAGAANVSSDLSSPWRVSFADPFLARFVRITLLGTGPLHLRRVQVFAARKEHS